MKLVDLIAIQIKYPRLHGFVASVFILKPVGMLPESGIGSPHAIAFNKLCIVVMAANLGAALAELLNL
jgi:hypothetical protein